VWFGNIADFLTEPLATCCCQVNKLVNFWRDFLGQQETPADRNLRSLSFRSSQDAVVYVDAVPYLPVSPSKDCTPEAYIIHRIVPSDVSASVA
jgi:hypothetical protein